MVSTHDLNAIDLAKVSEAIAHSGLGNPINLLAKRNDGVLLRQIMDLWKETLLFCRDNIEFATGENQSLFRYPVCVAITDSELIEACAAPVIGLDLIIVTTGLVRAIVKTTLDLVAHPAALPTVERESPTCRTSADQHGMLFPDTLRRPEFAMGTIHRALQFVALHELAHHFYGHIPFLIANGEMEVFYLRFAQLAIKPGIPKTDRHAIEIQADRYAADMTLMLAFRELWWNPIATAASSKALCERLERLAVKEWSAAMSIVFNLIESASIDTECHPHPGLRHASAVGSALVVFMSSYRTDTKRTSPSMHISPNEFLSLSNGIQADLDLAWQYLDLPRPSRPHFTQETFRNLINEAVELNKRLSTRFNSDHVV